MSIAPTDQDRPDPTGRRAWRGLLALLRPKSEKPKSRPRSIALWLHRWLGLTVGVILAMTGLTGSYLAFYLPIERAVIAPLRVSPGAQPVSLEALHQALIKVGPSARGSWDIEIPENGGVITSRFAERGQPRRMVSVDPVSLQVVHEGAWGQTVSTWIYELHYRLLMGRDGATVMGVFGLLLMVGLVTGGVLWWRSGRDLKTRLAYAGGSTQRQLYDVHRLLGLGAGVLLSVLVLTATAMNLPKVVRPALAAVSPISAPSKPPKSAPAEGRPRLTVDDAVAIARLRLPEAELRWVQVPNKANGAYGVRFWQKGEPNRRFPKTYVFVDQYSGQVLAVRDGLQGTASDHILTWLYPLHSGQAFGLIGRSIVALLGLTPTILLITGFLRWRAKRRSQAARLRRAAA